MELLSTSLSSRPYVLLLLSVENIDALRDAGLSIQCQFRGAGNGHSPSATRGKSPLKTQEWIFIRQFDFVFTFSTRADACKRGLLCAFVQQEDCCDVAALWALREGCTEHRVERSDSPGYMIETRGHVATAPPLFQSACAIVHVINPAASEPRPRLRWCEPLRSESKKKRLPTSDPRN